MDKLTKGTWIVNTTKHISEIKNNTQELSFYEATQQAGKAGALLGRLVADQQEIIPFETVKAFARQSHIGADAISNYLSLLKRMGKVDYNQDNLGRVKEVEIYCFSGTNAIETATDIYNALEPCDEEEASITALQTTYELPRYERELIEILSAQHSEEAVKNTIELQRVFSLVKESGQGSESVLFNEYAFTGDPHKALKAMGNLTNDEREMVTEVQQIIMDSQGFLRENIPTNIKPEIVDMMEGIGLLDGVTVKSAIGEATFLTTPQLRGHGLGDFSLSKDVFHKSKILLSCLRFGQTKSSSGRGRIDTQSKMENIVNKLVRGFWIGPCTAIGQDYQLLEIDGVIETKPYERDNRQYYMKLRQLEVGQLAQQMLSLGRVVPEADNIGDILKVQPSQYEIPEVRKQNIMAKATAPVKALQEKILNSIRTGGR